MGLLISAFHFCSDMMSTTKHLASKVYYWCSICGKTGTVVRYLMLTCMVVGGAITAHVLVSHTCISHHALVEQGKNKIVSVRNSKTVDRYLASFPGPARRAGERAWFQSFAHALDRRGRARRPHTIDIVSYTCDVNTDYYALHCQ